MYIPHSFAEERDDVVLGLARHRGFGHLVCTAGDGLASTPVPFVIDDAMRSVRAHLARPNPILRLAPCPALLIVPVADAYVSPGWYPSKGEHGRVVPTWNYEIVHLHGRLELRDDPDWIREQVGELTEQNEATMQRPWSVTDAPADFISAHLGAIVGVELLVDRIEAKRKLSQNRSDDDRAGVVRGLRAIASAHDAIAEAMDRH